MTVPSAHSTLDSRHAARPPAVKTATDVARLRASPPAIWTAFALQARWKNWVLLGQVVLIALLVLTCLSIAKTDPDIVVVDDKGQSHYVRRSVATQALIRFLATQKSQPSDLTVLSFTRRFCEAFFAPNSSTVRASIARALEAMDAKLRETTKAQLERDKVIESVEALKIRTELSIDALDEMEHTDTLIHLRVKLSRTVSFLLDGSGPKNDSLVVELVERVVPRTERHPDGLEVAEMVVSPGGRLQGANGSAFFGPTTPEGARQ